MFIFLAFYFVRFENFFIFATSLKGRITGHYIFYVKENNIFDLF